MSWRLCLPSNDLRSYGFVRTRAGRWIDPVTRRSLLTMEAWAVVNRRGTREPEWGVMCEAGKRWFDAGMPEVAVAAGTTNPASVEQLLSDYVERGEWRRLQWRREREEPWLRRVSARRESE